jgi:hypothetical protein
VTYQAPDTASSLVETRKAPVQVETQAAPAEAPADQKPDGAPAPDGPPKDTDPTGKPSLEQQQPNASADVGLTEIKENSV